MEVARLTKNIFCKLPDACHLVFTWHFGNLVDSLSGFAFVHQIKVVRAFSTARPVPEVPGPVVICAWKLHLFESFITIDKNCNCKREHKCNKEVK